jgi:multimeric flavodoxin WrbA
MAENRCVIEGDDLDRLMADLRPADALILASPVYWYSPTGVLKDFMDRTHGWYAVGGIFEGKVAGIVGVAADDGFEAHEAPIRAWLCHYGARIAATEQVYAREMGDLERAPAEMEKAVRLGRAIADAL